MHAIQVFDGHSGSRAAEFAHHHLAQLVLEQPAFPSGLPATLVSHSQTRDSTASQTGLIGRTCKGPRQDTRAHYGRHQLSNTPRCLQLPLLSYV